MSLMVLSWSTKCQNLLPMADIYEALRRVTSTILTASHVTPLILRGAWEVGCIASVPILQMMKSRHRAYPACQGHTTTGLESKG